VRAAADDVIAVGVKGYAPVQVATRFEGADFLAGLRVPDLQGAVVAATEDSPAVGAEAHAPNTGSVSVQAMERFRFALNIPYLYRSVVAAADNAFAVGAKGHTQDRACVPPECARFLVGLRVPDFQGPV